MSRHREYEEKRNPIQSILYVAAVGVLIIALVLMYMNNRVRRGEYANLVRDAAKSEMNYEIESRRIAEEEEADEDAAPSLPAPEPRSDAHITAD